MAKRDAMKRRLKAADRRRQRRTTGSSPPNSQPPTPESAEQPSDGSRGVDSIAQTILEHSDEMGPKARDSVVLVALRSVLRGNSPSCEDAQALAARLKEIPHKQDLPEKSFRDGMKKVLAMAESSRGSNQATSFLQYLSVLSS